MALNLMSFWSLPEVLNQYTLFDDDCFELYSYYGNRYTTCRLQYTAYSLSNVQCESKNPPYGFLNFFKRLGIFNQFFTHLGYYTIISTLDYKFLFKYLQSCATAILSATT